MRKALQLFSIFVFVFISTLLPSFSIAAQDISWINLHISDFTFSGEEDIRLEAWYISDETSIDFEKIGQDLSTKTNEDLSHLYQTSLVSEKINARGQAGFPSLPVGWYYVRQLGGLDKVSILPFLMYVDGKEINIEAKTTPIHPKDSEGYRLFQKVSTSTAPLGGAVFVVMEEVDGVLREVMKEGKPYQITSKADGGMKVGPLAYGQYYLKEIKAPAGYHLDGKPIAFDISETSDMAAIVKIKNKPITPPGIEIPQTGNATLIVVSSLGILLFLLGYRLVTLPDSHQ